MYKLGNRILHAGNKLVYSFGIGSDYVYKKHITIDNTKVEGTNDLTSFPVYFHLTGITTNNANGYDILFTDNNLIPLKHEIESYSNGTLDVWVNIPILYATIDTKLYLFYYNVNITTDTSSTDVWTSDYKAIYHLNNNNFSDSTINANTLSNLSTTNYATGKIAGARDFNMLSSQYMRKLSASGIAAGNVMTLSAWARHDSTMSVRNILVVSDEVNNKAFNMMFRNTYGFGLWMFGGDMVLPSYIFPSINEWHYYVATFDGANCGLYIDGEEVAYGAAQQTIQTGTWKEIVVGAYYDGGGGEYWDGQIDEPRFSQIVKSADWIKTEYNNQNSPHTFYTIS